MVSRLMCPPGAASRTTPSRKYWSRSGHLPALWDTGQLIWASVFHLELVTDHTIFTRKLLCASYYELLCASIHHNFLRLGSIFWLLSSIAAGAPDTTATAWAPTAASSALLIPQSCLVYQELLVFLDIFSALTKALAISVTTIVILLLSSIFHTITYRVNCLLENEEFEILEEREHLMCELWNQDYLMWVNSTTY